MKICVSKVPKGKSSYKKNPPPQENVKGRTKHSRRTSMSATALLTPYRSNWGGRAGGLGFCKIFIFSG